MKYEKLAKEIIEAVGGKENIISLEHCMTRLRFSLKDESRANDEKTKNIEGVISLVKKGGQYQVVIGTHVHDVYLDISKLIGIGENYQQEEKTKKTNLFNAMISTIIGTLGPIIPILIGTGLGKCLLLIVSMMGWANAETSMTYYIFNLVFDAGFTFLPVFVAVAAAKHFKCNPFMAALLGCALVHPNWNSIVDQLDPKIIGNMFGVLPIYGMPYTSSLIPALLVVWVMSKVEYGLNKCLPNLVKDMLAPLLTLLIMTPLTFIVLAPAMGILSTYIGNVILWVYNTFGMFAIAIMCIIYPWLVVTGMHSTLSIAGIQVLSQTGYDPFSRTLTLTANMAQGSAAVACAIKTKNKEFRSTCISAAFTAFFAGITEPCIYGVSLRLKKPMYAVMIGCFTGGLYAGFCGLKAYAFMTPSIINLPMWVGGNGNSNLINAVITLIISAVVTFIATLIIGFDDPQDETTITIREIASPVSGTMIDLSQVDDETFANKNMGEGVAIKPIDGKIYAPCHAVVEMAFMTKHAIGLKCDNGVEMLIHVGIDTVSLQGKYFDLKVDQGQSVNKGDLLLEADIQGIKEAGYNDVVIIVVTNSNQYQTFDFENQKQVNALDKIMEVQ